MTPAQKIIQRLRRRAVYAKDTAIRPPYIKYIALKSAINQIKEVLDNSQKKALCPFCKCPNAKIIQGGADGQTLWVKLLCDDCGKFYFDIYALSFLRSEKP